MTRRPRGAHVHAELGEKSRVPIIVIIIIINVIIIDTQYDFLVSKTYGRNRVSRNNIRRAEIYVRRLIFCSGHSLYTYVMAWRSKTLGGDWCEMSSRLKYDVPQEMSSVTIAAISTLSP